MTFEPREYETPIATLRRTRADLLEIHYHLGCTLNVADMTAIQEKRREVMGQARYGMITLIPDDVDFQMNTMNVDHLANDRGMAQVMATAVVARSSMIETLVKLYFSYYPQLHRVLVTDNEREARAWLEAQLAAVARTGS